MNKKETKDKWVRFMIKNSSFSELNILKDFQNLRVRLEKFSIYLLDEKRISRVRIYRTCQEIGILLDTLEVLFFF